MKPVVQISLDVTTIEEALETAELAVRSGVDWLEAGTPLILAEGLRCIRELRARFPQTPIVADLKTMDGGYLEAEMMAKAGANYVVVMSWATTWVVPIWSQELVNCKNWAAILLSTISDTTSVAVLQLVAKKHRRPWISYARLLPRLMFPCKPWEVCRSIRRSSRQRTEHRSW
jgi:3-keto-L-gulonate-6-phosphate decarboxylase